MKTLKPQPRKSPESPDYPTLRAGWRLLAAAAPLLAPTLALADATVPKMSPDGKKNAGTTKQAPPPQQIKPKPIPHEWTTTGGVMVAPEPPDPPTAPGKGKVEPPVPCPLKKDKPVAPTPQPAPPPKSAKKQKPEEFPEFDGGMGRVLRPRATTLLFAELTASPNPAPRALVIHPHDPGEPCAAIDPALFTKDV